jgi:uncharacterized tellurite resistance protein B-like protein
MADSLQLGDEVATMYAGALHSIARADGEITVEEGARLQALVAARSSVTIDAEMLFFDQTTPEAFAFKLRGDPYRGGVDPRVLGCALVEDAVALATSDGDLNAKEARAILRYARALGCTAEDVHARTDQLDEWLSDLS